MDIDQHILEKVICPDCILQYKNLHENIWHRLTHINTSIQILEKLEHFPFHHIYTPHKNVFWSMVFWNYLYTSIVMLHAIINDQINDALTLPRFKNLLRNDWLLPQEIYKLDAKLKLCKFSKNIEILKDRTRNMRHKIIAHVTFEANTGIIPEVPGLSISELRQLYTSVHQLFEVCCFGFEYRTSLYVSDVTNVKPKTEDIDEILSLVLKNSPWINQPELQPAFWPDIRKHKSKEEIDELNHWRHNLGMPDA